MSCERKVFCFSRAAATMAAFLALSAAPIAIFAQAPSQTRVQNVEKPHAVEQPSGAATIEHTTATPANADGKSAADGKGEEKKPESQEEQEHGFLVNGPIVKAIAGATGWSRDVTAAVFLWVNFAIIFFGIAIPLSRVMPKVLRKRREGLSHSLEEARKATADANTRLSAVEKKLAGLDAEIASFRAQVEEDSKADEQRMKASIEEEKTRIVSAAEQELNVAAAQAKRNLRTYAADLALTQAANRLNLTPEADRALISEFVADAEGGKN